MSYHRLHKLLPASQANFPLLRALLRGTAARVALGAGLLSSLAAPALALDPNTKDARAIAKAVEDRESGDRIVSRVTLTLQDAAGRKRVRKLNQQSLKFDGGTRSIIFFEAPADVRNTGLLSVDFDDGKKEDDQWLYLPSLHKSTRISTSDRSGSFMGTDLTYSDMTKKDPEQYDYAIIEQSVKVDGEDCWLLEARPRSEKEKKETGYVKTHTWISKSKLMPVQVKAWVKEGKKLKYMKFSNFEKIDGIWVAKRLAVRTVRGGKVDSQTLLETNTMKFNQASVTESQFSERRLEQGL
ncbi:MAG: outer membrane lipoprotein-sorting protein [Myxococcales bacterium]|nr:outer membrane lipoprotein-sorting protein [Myxococcales bacterium]